MKYYFWVTVFIVGSFFIRQNSLAANSDIIINEIGAYPTSTHEWVEIWNKGNEVVDIKDWKFWENNTNHGLKVVTTSDSMVSPGEFAVICQDSDVFLLDYPNFIGSVFDSSWSSLSEDGEEIGLKDASGNFVENFTYISTTKFSLERKNPFVNDYVINNWQENVNGNTVGVQNSNYFIVDNILDAVVSSTDVVVDTSTTSTPTTADTDINTSTSSTPNTEQVSFFDWSFLKINEIVSDPTTGSEMVELYNNSSSTIDITGVSICDNTGGSCKLLSGIILGHDWLVADLLTERYLNNDNDSVVLKDQSNSIIDEITYGNASLKAPEKGQAIIRKVDGLDNNDSDLAVTTKITLGASNELVAPVVAVNYSSSGGGSSSNNIVISPTTTTSTKNIKTISVATVSDPVKISFKLDWPYGLDVGEAGLFSTQGTADPRGGEINYLWNFGDNTTGTLSIISHTYATSGIYLASVVASSTAGTGGKKEFKIFVGSDYSINKAKVKITNYLVGSTSSEDDFVELTNLATSSQNISDWKIKNQSGKEYQIPENTIIRPSSTLKFLRAITHLAFDKDGDEIRLTSSNDQEVDKIILEKKKIEKVVITKPASVNNTWRVVKGFVTVLPNVFGKQYFYISDGQIGTQIYQYKKDFPDLKLGDYVEVSGEISDIDGIKRLKVKSRYNIRILNSKEIFEPTKLDISDFGDESLGNLILVSGDITEIKSTYFYIDDGVTEAMIYWKKSQQNKIELNVGDRVEVTGILDHTKDGFRVLPRQNTDLVVLEKAEQILSAQKNATQATEREVVEKYLTATAGGLTTLLLGFLARARGAILVGGAKKIAIVVSNIVKRG
ncbi:MAG: nucleic acid binding OB-fold tRNA/helicase-type [uncultured bacterium]|nr:MAG: nucleic acid binding OB-fold tRNA/helicase-type [uncultured bacterium]